MFLRGNKVILRDKRIEDATRDYAWRRDEELAKLDAASPLRTRFEDYKEFYAEELQFPMPRRCKFAVDDLSGKHIGNCMYYDMDKLKGQTEMGIMIGDKGYWDKGYGADAVLALLEHLFSREKMKRVYLHTLDWNKRAQRSFEKCGFVECDRVRRDGQSFVKMDISKDQWLANRNPALSSAT